LNEAVWGNKLVFLSSSGLLLRSIP